MAFCGLNVDAVVMREVTPCGLRGCGSLVPEEFGVEMQLNDQRISSRRRVSEWLVIVASRLLRWESAGVSARVLASASKPLVVHLLAISQGVLTGDLVYMCFCW
jgi:hypothetical protein